MAHEQVPEPRKAGRATLRPLLREVGRCARWAITGFMLVWLVGLVAWPERGELRARGVHEQSGETDYVSKTGIHHEDGTWQWRHHFSTVRELLESLPPGRYRWETTTQTWFPTAGSMSGPRRRVITTDVYARNASLSLLPDLLGL